MIESERIGDHRVALATRYIRHTAIGGLVGEELDDAETTYVLWDWDGMALLAYSQFLKHGRGVFIGPRTVIGEETLSLSFDYVPSGDASIAGLLSRELATSLRSNIDHYHPDFDFIVVWLRKDGTARYEVLRSDEKLGLRSPRDLFDVALSTADVQPNY